MVYLYYGFFLFLLYVTTPPWLFTIVALLSGGGMWLSMDLRKNMKFSLSPFGSRGEHAIELERRLKKRAPRAGRDQRRFKRFASSLDVSYQVLGDEWKKAARDHAFDTSIVYPEEVLSPHIHHALTWDISEGGLSIMSEHPLKAGEQLKISLPLPQHPSPTTLLAEVRRSKVSNRLGKARYHAGLKILALDQQDLDQLTDYLFAERN